MEVVMNEHGRQQSLNIKTEAEESREINPVPHSNSEVVAPHQEQEFARTQRGSNSKYFESSDDLIHDSDFSCANNYKFNDIDEDSIEQPHNTLGCSIVSDNDPVAIWNGSRSTFVSSVDHYCHGFFGPLEDEYLARACEIEVGNEKEFAFLLNDYYSRKEELLIPDWLFRDDEHTLHIDTEEYLKKKYLGVSIWFKLMQILRVLLNTYFKILDVILSLWWLATLFVLVPSKLGNLFLKVYKITLGLFVTTVAIGVADAISLGVEIQRDPLLKERFDKIGVLALITDDELVNLGVDPDVVATQSIEAILNQINTKDLVVLRNFVTSPSHFSLGEIRIYAAEMKRLRSFQVCLDEVHPMFMEAESNPRDDWLDKPNKKPRQRLTIERDDSSPIPEGFVFEGEIFFEDILLPTHLSKLTWQEVPHFLGSLVKMVNNSPKSNLLRGLKSICKEWKGGSQGRYTLKVFLCSLSFDENWMDEAKRIFDRKDIPFEECRGISWPVPHKSDFYARNDKAFAFGQEINPWFEGLLLAPKSKHLTLSKLKGILNTTRESGKTHKQCVQRVKDLLGKNANPSWIVPWIPTEVLYLYERSGGSTHLLDYMHGAISCLRKHIVDFSYEYLKLGDMFPSDRDLHFRNRAEAFKRVMQSERIQTMFWQDIAKQDIIDYVYKHKGSEFNLQSSSSVLSRYEKRKKMDWQKYRAKARYQKWAIYESESMTGSLTNVAIYIATIVGFLTYINFQPQIIDIFRRIRILTVQNAAIIEKGKELYVKGKDTIAKIDNAADKLLEFVDQVEKFVSTDSFLDAAGNAIADIKKIVQIIYFAILGEYKWMLDAFCDLVLRHPSILKKVTHEAFSYVTKMTGGIFSSEKSFVAETGSDNLILSPFVSLLYAFSGQNLTPLEMRDANTRMQYMTGIAKFWSDTSVMCKAIVSFVGREVFSYDPFDPEFQGFSEEVCKFIKDADGFVLKETDIPVDKKLCQKIIDARDKGVSQRSSEIYTRLNGVIRKLHEERFKMVERFATKADATINCSGTRPEPVGILITGKPGTGKSQAIVFLCRCLAALHGDDFEPHHVYTGGVQKYYDMYKNQGYFVMDDAFAEVDDKVRAEEGKFIIKAINSVPLNLEMAECEMKGKVFFASSYLFLSTNLANEGYSNCNFAVGVTDPGAITRRLHISIHANKKFKEGDDLAKVEMLIEKCALIPEAVGVKMTIPEIARLIHAKRMQHIEWFKQNNKPQSYFYDLMGVPMPEEYKRPDEKPTMKAESLYSGIRDHIADYVNITKPENRKAFDWAFKGFLALTAALTIGAAAMAVSSFFQDDMVLESDERYKIRFARHVKRQAAKEAEFKATKYEPQSTSNFDTCLNNSIHRGLVSISFWDGCDEPVDCFNGWHIKDGLIMTVAHGMVPCIKKQAPTIKVKWCSGYQVILTKELQMCRYDGYDFVLFRLPDSSNLPASLFKYVVDAENDYDMPYGLPVTVLHVDNNGDRFYRRGSKATDDYRSLSYEVEKDTFIVESPLHYYATTSRGDSGAPVAAMARDGRAQICAIHLCGSIDSSRKTGGAFRFNKTTIGKIVDAWFGRYEPHSNPTFPLNRLNKVGYDATYPPMKHSLTPSPMFEVFGPSEKSPAVLTRSAYYKAVAKMRQDDQVGKWKTSKESSSYMLNLYPPQKSVVRTISEAINGYTDFRDYNMPALRMDTCGGYGFTDKSEFIKRETSGLVPTPSFVEHLEKKMEELRSGGDHEFIFYDCLKVELRPNEKVESESSRLFSCSPLDLTVLMRQLFGDFVCYVQSKSSTHPICVGLNVHGIDWKRVADHILEFGGGVLAGDCSKFDASVKFEMMMQACDDINQWYNDSEENQTARLAIMKALANCTHVFFDIFYKTSGGNPSGEFITSILNSWLLTKMFYDILSFDVHLRADQFCIKTYGDDSAIGLPPDCVTYQQMTICFKERFDIDYTHWSKKPFSGTDSLWDIRFLGRKFEYHENQLMAPLAKPIVQQMCYYYENKDLEVVMLSTSASYFLESSHFGEKEFKVMQRQYLDAVAERMPKLLSAITRIAYDYWYYYNGRYSEDRKILFSYVPDESGWPKPCVIKNNVLRADALPVVTNPVTINELCEKPKNSPVRFQPESKNAAIKQADPELETNEEPRVQESVLGATQAIGAEVDAINTSSKLYPWNLSKTELKALLEREVYIGTFSFTNTTANGTLVASYKFPGAMINNASYSMILTLFRAFRAGLKIRVTCSSAKTNYGLMLADWYPYHCNTTANTVSTTIRSGREHYVIRHELNETTIMEFPFAHPYRFMDIINSSQDEMGLLSFSLLSPYSNVSGTTATCIYTVYAAFTEPELALPVPPPGLTMSEEFEDVGRVVPVLKKAFEPESNPMTQESISKAKSDTFMQLTNRAHEIASTVTVSDVARILGAISTLDKPPNSSLSSMPQPKYWVHDFHGSGVDNAVAASNSQGACTGTDELFGFTPKTLAAIACTPMYNGLTSVPPLSSTVLSTPIITTVLGPSSTNPTFDTVLSACFDFRSGGYKYKAYWSCSTQQTARIVYYLAPTTSTTTGKEYQYCRHVIVDVCGPTDVEFFIPEMCQGYTDDDTTVIEWGLWLQVLSYSNPGTGTPFIFAAHYLSAAEDVRFAGPLDMRMTFVPNSNPRRDFKKPFKPFTVGDELYIPSGFVADQYTDIRELLKTKACMGVKNNGTAYSNYWPSAQAQGSTNTFFGMNMYVRFFLFWRGSVVYKFYSNLPNENCMMYLQNNNANNRPFADLNNTQCTPVCELRSVYNRRMSMTGTTITNASDASTDLDHDVMRISPKGGGTVWCAAGDDFDVAWLQYPNGTISLSVTTDSATGISGAITSKYT